MQQGIRPPRWRCLACGLVLSLSIVWMARAEDHEEDPEDSAPEWLEISGDIEVAYERRQNFDLDNSTSDDVDLLPVEIKLEFLFEPNDTFMAYFQPTLGREIEIDDDGPDEDRNTELLIEEAYVALSSPDQGVSLRIGRQNFDDVREWLYDEDLDGVRGFFEAPGLAVELSVTQEGLFDKDLLNQDEIDDIINTIFFATYEPAEEFSLGAYGLTRDFEDPDDDRLAFVGLRATGALDNGLSYWIDAAHVRGREDGTTLRGYAIDALGTWVFDVPLAPRITLGYAFGTGDSDPDDNRDHAFRQTGLHGNEHEIGGEISFNYYGEAFDPELSNMSIFTAGLGAWPLETFSVDVIYHYYHQDEASDELRDSAFEAEPEGKNRSLGNEVDLVFRFEPFEDLEVRGFFGYFMPGNAFASGADDALFAAVEFEFEF